MGKIKNLMIDKQNAFEESLQALEENTKELECQSFDEEIDLSGVRSVLTEIVKIIKEVKEIILL